MLDQLAQSGDLDARRRATWGMSAYVCYDHFARAASDAEIVDYTRAIGAVCEALGVAPGDGGNGYRMIANSGNDGVQEVPHLHVHILAGRNIGPMVLMRP